MNIETFIAQMNGDHKESVIQKHIIRQYVPLEEKIAAAKNIITISCYKDVIDANGNKQKMFWLDSVTKHFLTMKAIIEMYTDLKFSDDPVKDYNVLAEKKYDQMIFAALPSDDVEAFSNIIDMVYDDENENVNSLEGRIKNFIFGFDGVLQHALVQMADNAIESEVDNGKREMENSSDT